MQLKGEIFWEVGKTLTKHTWEKGECVTSPEFPIMENCSLIIEFYPAGIDSLDFPLFRRIRTNTNGAMEIEGKEQLCHAERVSRIHAFYDDYHDGECCANNAARMFEGIGSFHDLKIFHYFPELCYRLIYNITVTLNYNECTLGDCDSGENLSF
ncbi:uncharacterized protein CDAR_371161 [Caerostris darwini]|uniref:Uncharacterized protein n=1 Tax=Caerostris darwini TaxID=1538125 RepID=A0AAV4T219_9ARAC|nr:uncharacterized protein CDAR_371161 [Caerostris darwini]